MKRFALLAAAAALMVGCSQDMTPAQNGATQTGNGQPAVVGTPGNTGSQGTGYDANDPAKYHPQTDDVSKYKPADPNTVQPAGH